MSIDYTPSMGEYKPTGSFKFWCQKVLPLVYDDSLSYYETLCKVASYLNDVIQNSDTLDENVRGLYDAYVYLQDYVNNYFNNLNVQNEINEKLDNMASDGSLSALIQPLFDTYKITIDNTVNTQNEEINVLKARMDTFTSLPDGGTTGDAELQDIRVGANGVVYPTAGDAVRTQISDLNRYNSVNFIKTNLETTESNGVIFTWNNEICSIVGTTTGPSFYNMFVNISELPFGIKAGESYYIKFTTSNTLNVKFGVIPYVNGIEGNPMYFTEDSKVTIPYNTTGLIVRIAILGAIGTTINATVTYGGFLSAKSNKELTEIITDVDNTVKVVNEKINNVYESTSIIIFEGNKNNATINGITYEWYGNECSVVGTTTAISSNNLYYDNSALPLNIKEGETYYVKFSTTNTINVRLAIIPYINGTEGEPIYCTSNTEITIPSNTTGLLVRIAIIGAIGTTVNDVCKFDGIYTTSDIVKNMDAILKQNPILVFDGDKTTVTSNGITYAWSDNRCLISGITTGISNNNLYYNANKLPDGINANETYYIKFESTPPSNARFTIIPYANNIALTPIVLKKSSYITIPNGTTGLLVRVNVVGDIGTKINAVIEYDGIFTVGETNRGLMERVSDLEKRVGNKIYNPMLTLIDDDGHGYFYRDLYPLAVEKSVPIASAIPYAFIDTSVFLTTEQIKEMYSSGYVEILSHTYSHLLDENATIEEFEVDYRKAKHCFSLMGIPCNILIYGGATGNRDTARTAASYVYDGAIMSGNQTINYCGDDKYQLRRYGVNGDGSDGRLNGEDLNTLKQAIDVLEKDGGWMIWMLHTSSNYWTESMKNNIASAIDYTKSKNIPIVTTKYGFDTYYGTKTLYHGNN